MKKIILLFAILLSSLVMQAEIKQEGNNFIEIVSQQQDELTIYTYTDKNGNVYPIYKSKSGKFYIKKISKKTGKEYKSYLPKEIQEKLKQSL